MILGVRRLLAVAAIGIALLFAAPTVFAAAVPSPSPTPGSTGKSTAKATAQATPTSDVDSDDDNVDDTPDTAPDNSRMLWLLGGAGVVAVGAAVIVIARR